jgi:large subunit ribosomal protein L7/L12
VVLEGYEPAGKLNVLRAVRELLGLGLKEARDLLDGLPRVLKERLPTAEAEAVKARLQAAGARIALK